VRFTVPFVFLALAILAAALGPLWSFGVVALIPLSLLGLDGVLGQDAGQDDKPRAESASGARTKGLPRAFALCQTAAIGFTTWRAAQTPDIAHATSLVVSMGVCAGVFGMLAAHDLIHSPNRADRAIGLLSLWPLGYMHFRIAHIHGHHRRAATPEDPASARLGEPVYGFLLRSVAGQWREAWLFEHHRLRRRGGVERWAHNRMAHYIALEVGLALGVAVADPRFLIPLLGQAVIAVVMLELFNYVAHYGLRRERAGSGYRRLEPRHCWSARGRMNNAALFNMGRHSDHHARPLAPYAALGAVETEADLPYGYAGAILLALVPPLWRRVMDPRALALSGVAHPAGEQG